MSAHPPPVANAPESATTALYRAALGPVNTAHYLAVFERFDEAGRASPVWNPAAGLLTLNWMVFRRLWGPALMYLAGVQGLALLVLVLARRFLQWPPSVEWGVLLALLLLSIAIPGAYGNAWLHADVRRRMTRAVREARTVREACATLEKQTGSRRRLGVLVGLNLLLAGAVAAAGLNGVPSARAPLAQTPDAPAPTVTAAPPEPASVPSAASAAAAEPEPASRPEPGPEQVVVTPPVLPPPPSLVATLSVPAEPAPTVAPAPVAPRAIAPGQAPKAAPVKEAAPRSAPSRPPAAAAAQAHGINVGLFADPANAEKAHARLAEAGFPAILQKVESPNGGRTRVRVGPFAGRAQADEAAARIRAMGLDAVVFAP